MGWWKRVPVNEKERLAGLDRGALVVEAERLGVHPKSLYNRVGEWRQARTAVEIPPSPAPDYNEFFVVNGDDFLIIGDLEIPDHDATILRRSTELAATWNIRRLVIAGDFMHLDQFSTWPSLWARTDDLNFADSLKIARQMLTALAAQFDDIWIISGNHDQRLAKANNGQIHLGMFLESESVHFSQYGYMYLYTSRGPVYIGHLHGGGKGLTAAQNTYNVITSPSGEKCHIVLPHYHWQSSTWSADGLRELHLLPCTRDAVKTKYKRLSANPHRAWITGALLLRRAFFYPCTKHGTDWQEAFGVQR